MTRTGPITVVSLSLAGIVIKQLDPEFPLTGQEMTFCAIVASVAAYVVVSLAAPGEPCDMDRLLHRGRYAVGGESSVTWGDARTWWEFWCGHREQWWRSVGLKGDDILMRKHDADDESPERTDETDAGARADVSHGSARDHRPSGDRESELSD